MWSFECTTFLPARYKIILVNGRPANFDAASIKVGSVPVVRPLNVCKVVVGGLAINDRGNVVLPWSLLS